MLQRWRAQIASEIAGARTSQASLFGFAGGCCNWFLGMAAVYDASSKGPEVISLNMTFVMMGYSSLFARWAGWAISPRNYILAGSHMFNVAAQTNQLRRVLQHKLTTQPNAQQELGELGTKAAVAGVVVAGCVRSSAAMREAAKGVGPAYLASEAGPFTIHPWPAVSKLFISGASLLEFDRPTDKISLPQYSALTLTGAIFSRYGLLVSPINYPISAVNVLLFLTSAWHLSRKVNADYL